MALDIRKVAPLETVESVLDSASTTSVPASALGYLLVIHIKTSSVPKALSLTKYRMSRPTAPSVAAIQNVHMEDFEVSVKSLQIRSYIPLNTYTLSSPSPCERL